MEKLLRSFDRGEKQNFLDDEIRLRWSIELINGISYMHSNRIGHRDLTPANVYLLNKNDQMSLKIGDFGLSKEITSYFKSFVGSVYYQSPEIIKGIAHTLKTDVW